METAQRCPRSEKVILLALLNICSFILPQASVAKSEDVLLGVRLLLYWQIDTHKVDNVEFVDKMCGGVGIAFWVPAQN